MDEQQPVREQVGQAGRILEGVAGIGVEGPASVGPQLLDRLLGGHRASGDSLGLARDGGEHVGGVEVLLGPLGDEDDGGDGRDGDGGRG